MRWCRGVAAALLVSVPLLPELHAGPIAEYLEDAGLGKHGAAFEAVASKQTLDLDALQALEAFELGELCTEADMSTREAIAFSRALRRRAAGGGAGAGRPAFGSSLGSASGSARRPAPPEPAPPMVERPQLRHQRRVPLAPSLPRVSVEDLASDDPAFEKFRRRSHPFILTGAMEDFKMIERFQDLEYLGRMFPNAVTDFYPYNMVRPPPSPPPPSRSRLSARALFCAAVEGPAEPFPHAARPCDPADAVAQGLLQVPVRRLRDGGALPAPPAHPGGLAHPRAERRHRARPSLAPEGRRVDGGVHAAAGAAVGVSPQDALADHPLRLTRRSAHPTSFSSPFGFCAKLFRVFSIAFAHV